MDKNTVTGIVLIFLIFVGFTIYNNQRTGKFFRAETEYADSLYKAGNYDEARNAYIRALGYRPKDQVTKDRVIELNQMLGLGEQTPQSDTTLIVSDSSRVAAVAPSVKAADSTLFGAFSSAATGENALYTIENNKIRLTVSSKGGRLYSAMLKDYKTYDSLPVVLFNGDSTVFGYKFFTTDNKAVITNDLYFTAENYTGPVVTGDKPASLTMRLNSSGSGAIEYTYTLRPDDYMIDYETRFINAGSVIPSNTTSLVFDWKMYVPQQEKGRINEDNYTELKYKAYQDGVESLSMRQKKEIEKANLLKTEWIAYKDQFFSSVLIADGYFLNAYVSSTKVDPTSRFIRFFDSEMGISYPAGQDAAVKMKMYMGPNSFPILKKYKMDLEELVFLGKNIIRGINQYIIIPIFNWLEKHIYNYGIIILILTLIIKLVLAPLTHRSFMSQAKMRVLKPQVDQLAKKYPKQEDAMKKQQATMDLYKRAGVSPMGGCLPTLLQMPILFAMFRFFPTSIELRQKSFLWAQDLSTYDSILNFNFNIPIYGSHVSLFTLLMTVSTIISSKISNPSGGQEQMPGMKSMIYLMPVMFMVIMNNLSAGLTYYYLLTNIISIIQTQVSLKLVNEDAILKKLEENKKKPVKKSKWQQRLEAASKQSGYKPVRK